jgi:hypothetical protein
MEINDELVQKITEELWRRLGPPSKEPAVSASSSGRRRVLTEAEVRIACPVAGGPGQTLRLAPGDLLTPLARDYVQSLKIDLSRD